MLRLLIGTNKECITSADKRQMKVYPIFASQNCEPRPIWEWRKFTLDTEVQITVTLGGILKRNLKVPFELQIGIGKFLHEHHGQGNVCFDCYSFVNMVAEVEPHNVVYLQKYWDFKPYGLWHQVGDIIFLLDTKMQSFHHAAIYIGFGFYISVYGAGGDLEVATLSDMKKDFGAKNILLATPNQN